MQDNLTALNVVSCYQMECVIGVRKCCLGIWETAVICFAFNGIECGSFIIQKLKTGYCMKQNNNEGL